MILLIADDDRLVRFTIKSILKDIRGDAGDIFLEAGNGVEMVKLCGEHHPDIAFVDIRMPILSGLEAIEESRKKAPDTEYVIVSGYSDFEYAQRGMRLGVGEYLLKPVDEEEMRKVMGELTEKIRRCQSDSNSHFRLSVMEAFNYYAVLGAAEEGAGKKEVSYCYVVFMLWIRGGRSSRAQTEQVQKKLMDGISDLGRDLVSAKGYYAIAYNSCGTPCIVFKVEKGQVNQVFSRMKTMARSVCSEKVRHYFLWFAEECLEDVCIRCEKAEEDLCLLMQENVGAVCRHEEMRSGEDERAFLRLTEKLTEAWAQADGMACKEILNSMWRGYGNKKLDLRLGNLSGFCGTVTESGIPSDSLKAFCRAFVENSDEMYRTSSPEEKDVADQVKAYVKKYYRNDISISQIAENLGLTANYLSTVFRQRTGRKLIDYLTQVRMEAAKKLLCENTTASVQDIALMVGYNSSRHFSTLFQKQTGMTPTAYRRAKEESGLEKTVPES